jgi:hypothetical protein
MATDFQLSKITKASRRASDLKLLRRLAMGFIWLGAVACGAHLLLAIPSVSSFTHFLGIVIETIGRLSATVGLGGVLLALAEIAEGLRTGLPRLGSSDPPE